MDANFFYMHMTIYEKISDSGKVGCLTATLLPQELTFIHYPRLRKGIRESG